MEHQNHSTGNSVSGHQTFTTSAGSPSFRVYVDMGSTIFANGSTVYSSKEDESKTCIDALGDDAHYKFSCRCGCGAQFAGYGKDIKAAAKVGRAFKPVPVLDSAPPTDVFTAGTIVGALNELKPSADTGVEIYDRRTRSVIRSSTTTHNAPDQTPEIELMAPSPYVSDRFLKKALYGLSDAEIDSYHENKPDPLEASGINLSERQPPAIGDMVYSLSTGAGPYSVIDYMHREVKLEGGETQRVLCALLRSDEGKYLGIPLADLALHFSGRAAVAKKRNWVWSSLMAVMAAVVGSGIAIGLYSL